MSAARFETASAEETQALGRRLGALAEPGDLYLLRGPLGAGKTTLTQGIAWGADAGGLIDARDDLLAHAPRSGPERRPRERRQRRRRADWGGLAASLGLGRRGWRWSRHRRNRLRCGRSRRRGGRDGRRGRRNGGRRRRGVAGGEGEDRGDGKGRSGEAQHKESVVLWANSDPGSRTRGNSPLGSRGSLGHAGAARPPARDFAG